MVGAATWAALAVSLWRAAVAPGDPLAFEERIHVTTPGVTEPLLAPLTRGARLTERDLIALGGDLPRAFDIAAQAAGAFAGTRRVRVDGMVSAGAADGRAAAGVSVRTDPFSVEYGGLDQIDLALELPAPSRRWMFTAAPPIWRTGGADALTGRAPDVQKIGATLAGPGPVEALTFFAHAARFTQHEIRAFASPDATAVMVDAQRMTTTRADSATAGMAWSGRAMLVRANLVTSRTQVANAGVGGLVTADAAFALDTTSSQAHLSWDVSRGLRQRGAVRFRTSRTTTIAGDRSPAIVSAAGVVTGAEIVSRANELHGWALRHVTQPSHQRWLLGLEIVRDETTESRDYNAHGVRRVGADGRSSLTTTSTAGDVSLTATSAAAFAQRIVRLGPGAALRAGVRAEWFESEGVFLSPRVSLGARIGGFVLTAAVALSPEEWSAAELAGLGWRDLDVAEHSVDGRPLRLVIDEGFARRRDRIVRVGAARQLRRVQAAIEYTWTHGSRLTGATRAGEDGALIDTLAGDRELVRHQTHVSAQTRIGPVSIVGHYEAMHSHDNTDGWWSFPATPGDVRGEWARSTGLPRHQGSIVASGQLPGRLHLVAAARSASGSPYSILSGLDPAGTGTFTDRSGHQRNSGQTAGWSSVSAYLSRTFRIPRLQGTAVDVGVRIENALGTPRVDEVGRVLATPLFGRALSAGPGRAVSVWFALARR